MHCPNCGTKNSPEHKFCRACGLGLEQFALTLAEQLPQGAGGRAQAEELLRLAARERRVERLLTAAASALVTLFVGAIFYALIVKIIIGKGRVLEGLIFLSIIVLGLVSVGLVIYRESLKERMQKRPEALPGAAETTGRLLPDPHFEPARSVTDATTELLEAEPVRAGGKRAEGGG